MKEQIIATLKDLEKEKDIEILYACESGSRAWGFESQDSDWDVRFIYKKHTKHYLTLGNPRDVVEVPFDKKLGDELDLVGWDIKKSLSLTWSSNPSLIEWIFSPVVYYKNDEVLNKLQQLALNSWQPRALAHHYISMGHNNYSKFVKQNDNQQSIISVKKLLYVMRSILNCLYIKNLNKIPPINFNDMYNELLDTNEDQWLITLLTNLVEKKKGLEEADLLIIEPKLDQWIQSHLDRRVANEIQERPKGDLKKFDDLFHEVLGI